MARLLRSQPGKPLVQPQKIQGPAYALPVFTSACNTTADFTSVNGSGITVGNAGTGYLGKSIRVVPVASVEQSARKVYGGLAAVHQLWVKTGASDTFSTTVDFPIFSGFADASYGTPIIQIRLIGSGAGYTVRTVDPTNGYATSVGSTVLSKGVWHRIVLSMTSAGFTLYVDNGTAAEATYVHANATVGLFAGAYGNWYMGTGAFSGTIDIDELYASNLAPGLTTLAQQTSDAVAGYFQKYLAYDGSIVRSPTEGTNNSGAAAPDVVSEGMSYGLRFSVQNNDQARFILIDNWIRANLDRRNSTVGNTQNNAAPTNALNLMSFKYNPSNPDGKGAGTIYDANWAGDADVERAQALLWAHARWGSSALTVDTGPELITPNYLQRALNILADLRSFAFRNSTSTGFNYLVADQFQTGDAVVIAADYNNPSATKLFAQYDSGNAAFWNNAISGAYDILTKAANQIFTGQTITKKLNTNWIGFTLSTGLTSAAATTYGNGDYGFNAFRTGYRLYDMYTWYADASALAALQLPKAFFTSEWTTNASIKATYAHDGTSPAAYDKNMFYWPAYWAIWTGDNANTTAAAIKSGKLDNKYLQSPVGSYIDNTSYNYFDQSWSIIGSMQKAGTLINYGQSASLITTKTQTGVSRLTSTTSRTQTGVSRISNTTTRTQTGVSNIAAAGVVTTPKTQTGKARITSTTTRTQAGISRITNTTTKTETGVARIQVTTVKTQTGVSRITGTTPKTQTGVANISVAGTTTTPRTQTGKARIAGTTAKTQTGIARITATTTKTQTGVARIGLVTSKTQPGLARITGVTTRTQTGISRITATSLRTQSGVARITSGAIVSTKTQAGVSRITATSSRTQTGISRIQITSGKTQSGVSRIGIITTKTQTGVSRLSQTTTRTQTGVANIFTGVTTRTQTGVARISGGSTVRTRTQTGVANIKNTIIVKTSWTPSSELDATAVAYDASSAYDSAIIYDGANATLIKPKITTWT